MRPTTAIEKLLTSAINTFCALLISLPWFLLFDSLLSRKVIVIGSFAMMLFLSLIFSDNRNPGMLLIGSYWNKPKNWLRMSVYNLLYTLSFASLFFDIILPFDLAVVNIFILQARCVYLTKTTIHGYLAGGFISMKKRLLP